MISDYSETLLYPSLITCADNQKKHNPVVGVIMRTKDRPLLLHRAISSVISQKYMFWHLYLVNDGGLKDDVERILNQYRSILKDKITVLHHENSHGMEAASNAALGNMKDEDYIVVHDDDDTWHPDFLKLTTEFLNAEKNLHFIAANSGCTLIYEMFQNDEVVEISRQPWTEGRKTTNFIELMAGNLFPPISLLIRRNSLQLIGGFNSNLPVLGDWDANLRLSLIGDIGYVDRPLAYYHHRISGTNSVYSNTVVDGQSRHIEQLTLYRNAMIRNSLKENPHLFGLFLPAMQALKTLEIELIRLHFKEDIILEKIDRLHSKTDIILGIEPKNIAKENLHYFSSSAFNWLFALIEIELSKFFCTVGLKGIGEPGWNHGMAIIMRKKVNKNSSLIQMSSAYFEREIAKFLCTFGNKKLGKHLWNSAVSRIQRGQIYDDL